MPKSERKNAEILAPAGNMEALICAINNGANAVYLGLKQFNARAKAGNFTYEELSEAVKFAHFFGVRVYTTFNVLYKKSEYQDVLSAIKKCKEIGVDAFILQDFAFISYLKSTMPDIIVHLSTQAGIHNLDGAIVAEKMGVNRVILSREALIEDIKQIKENTNLEIECFVQGALCISFSGNCYFSSIVSGYSGNRGKCLQLCRKKYTFKGKQAYWLSPKDVSISDNLDELLDAGVTSLKIEGRMRRPEYVGEAVNCYKTLLSGEKYDINRLKKLFNRGNYTTIYTKHAKNNVIYEKTQNHIGVETGKVTSVSPKKLDMTCNLSKGDGIKIFRDEIEVGNALISQSGCSTTYQGNVKIGDTISVTTDCELNAQILAVKRQLPFDLFVEINQEKAEFCLIYDDICVKKTINDLQPAITSGLTKEQILDCFLKTSDYKLKLQGWEISIDYDVFMQKSYLNSIRRELCEQLSSKILASYKNPYQPKPYNDVFSQVKYFNSDKNAVIFQTDSIETANLCKNFIDYVAYFPKKFDNSVINDVLLSEKPVLLTLPNVARGKDLDVIKGILSSDAIENVIVNNIYGLNIAKNKNILLGPMMNVINPDFSYPKIVSVEGVAGKNTSDFVYYYGKFPIMTYCHCPMIAYYGKCVNCNSDYKETLTDQLGNQFSLYPYRINHCYCYLLNDRPINLSRLSQRFNKKFIDLIGVDRKICYNILEAIRREDKIQGGTPAYYNKNLE